MTTQTTPEAATRRLLPSTSRPPHTVEEVAARLRVSKMTVYRLIHDGELGHLRVGRSFRIPEPDRKSVV